MINVAKTKLMTSCAIYEKHEGREDIEMSKYYKADYVRFGLLRTIIAVTCGFVLAVVVYLLYHIDHYLEIAFDIDFKQAGIRLGLAYGIILALYLIIMRTIYSIKYVRSRQRLAEYYRNLGKINKLNDEEPPVKDLSGAEYDTTS